MRINKKSVSRIILESFLIIFSVFLAFFINEYRNSQKEEELKKKALENIRKELLENQQIVARDLQTHREIYQNVQTLIRSGVTEAITDSLFSGEIGFNIFYFTNAGSLAPDLLNDAAWLSAQNANIIAAFDYDIILSVSQAYNIQGFVKERMSELINTIFFNRESFDEAQLEKTLILVRDAMTELSANEEYLIDQYELAIRKISGLDETESYVEE